MAALLAAQAALLSLYGRVERSRAAVGGALRIERASAARRAPDLRLESASGETVALPARTDRPRLVHFWATWCPPCRTELPRLLAETRRLERAGRLQVVAIATDTAWTEVRAFFRGKVPIEVLRDADGSAYRSYGVTNLPDTYLVGGDGMLRARLAGAQPWRARDVAALLEE